MPKCKTNENCGEEMVMAVVDAPAKEPFTEFPQSMDNYFEKNEVMVKVLPDGVLPDIEKNAVSFRILSASQYHSYLVGEIEFWKTHDEKNKLKEFHYISKLELALSHFKTAYNHSHNTQTSTVENYLRESTNAIKTGTLYSKCALSKHILKYIDQSQEFFNGFRQGISAGKSGSVSTNIGTLEGFLAALAYRKFVKNLHLSARKEIDEYVLAVSEANKHFADLNYNYTKAFHEQEARIASITEQTNQCVEKLDKDAETYFQNRDARCNDLEKLYEEKLRLQGPAKYWAEMEKEYKKRGNWWFVASLILTMGIIGMLITILVKIPVLFTEDSHWFEIFKNSAIITVITSVAVYILRLFVKMTVSSYHLARDAKERNNLTYFYLALIENKAVTEKERAIVLNSLFSRADTGLLKGDSTPAMSGNPADLISGLANK